MLQGVTGGYKGWHANEVADSFRLEFEIVKDSTKRGRPKLIDNRGYTYNVQRRRGENTDWQCTVRPKVCVFFSLDSGDIYVTDDHDKRALWFGEYLLLISMQKLTKRSNVNFCR